MAQTEYTPQNNAHLTVSRQVSVEYDRVVCVETWEGPYEDCLAKAKDHTPGHQDSNTDIEDAWPIGVDVEPYVFCAGSNIRRLPGNIGICQITYMALFNLANAGMEMTAVSKPIKTWKAADEENAPDLGQIQQWEAQKETNYEAYKDFKYDGSTAMTGNTEKLAKMIFQGIESFTEYVPVITLTFSYHIMPEGAPDDGANLGKQQDPFMPSGCTEGAGIPAILPEKTWVNTGDRLTGNNDSTFTRQLQWSGFDSVNEDLYPAAEDDSTPSEA